MLTISGISFFAKVCRENFAGKFAEFNRPCPSPFFAEKNNF
jgi:hypothetical protein